MLRLFCVSLLFLSVSSQVVAFEWIDDAELRKSSQVGFVTQSRGVHFDYLMTQPTSFGYYPSEKYSVAIEYGTASFDLDSYDVFHQFKGTYQHIGFVHRWFPFSGSFNIKQGLFHNQLQTNIKLLIEDTKNTPFKNATYTYTEFKNTTLLYGLGIGNQWSFRQGILVGVDYVIKNKVITQSSTRHVTSDSERSSASLTQAENQLSGLEQTVTNLQEHMGVLLFTLGFHY